MKPVSPGASGMQPRDPCRPWRGTLATPEDFIAAGTSADIVIAAVGKARMITEEMLGDDQVIIDVGINMDENGRVFCTLDFFDVVAKFKIILLFVVLNLLEVREEVLRSSYVLVVRVQCVYETSDRIDF